MPTCFCTARDGLNGAVYRFMQRRELADRLVALRHKWPSASRKGNGVRHRLQGWKLQCMPKIWTCPTVLTPCSGGPVPPSGLWERWKCLVNWPCLVIRSDPFSSGTSPLLVGILHATLQIFNQFCLLRPLALQPQPPNQMGRSGAPTATRLGQDGGSN